MTEDQRNKQGGSAFPINEKGGFGDHYFSHLGMTLRDYFAAQAITGFCDHMAASSIWETKADRLAAAAYRLADAMLQARQADR